MIFSNISDTATFARYPEAIQRALQYLSNMDFSKLEDGKQEIDGDRMFANLFHTKARLLEETCLELHKKYIDLQYWVSGEELFGIAPVDGVRDCIEASDEKDLYLYKSAVGESFIHAWKGCFAIFFPEDAHRPGVCYDGKTSEYRKVVVKISVEEISCK